jgi:SAM-dependent methyltransferase
MMQKSFHVFLIICILTFEVAKSFSIPSSQVRTDQLQALHKFTSCVNDALSGEDATENFRSFVLKGRKVPKTTKTMSDEKRHQINLEKERLRGQIREISGRLVLFSSKKKKGNENGQKLCVQTTIKYHGATDVVQNYDLLGFGDKLFHLIHPEISTVEDDVTTKKIVSEWGALNHGLSIQYGELITREGKWDFNILGKKSFCKFSKRKETMSVDEPLLSHDQPKSTLLSPSALFFQKLGITDAHGKPKATKSSKLRQCQKFVEIVARLVHDSKIVNETSKLRSVDMGCGRGYLTFALHSYLNDNYKNIEVESIGVDVRPKLMNEVNEIARGLGREFNGLTFETGTIENVNIEGDIDILLALHACDTATDDSIYYGLKKQARIIVTAPCCHKEVRRYLDLHVSRQGNVHPYYDVLRHNIYKERIAETVTDSIRALLLELADYDVQVFEFIGGEHTAKNVMICAVKRTNRHTEEHKQQLRKRLRSLADLHGIQRQKLADLMSERLALDDKVDHRMKLSRRKMPLI